MTGINSLSKGRNTKAHNGVGLAGHDTEKSISPDNLDALKAKAERPTAGRMYELYKIISKPNMFTAYPPVIVTVDRTSKRFCEFHTPSGLKGRVYLPSETTLCLFVPIHTRTRL